MSADRFVLDSSVAIAGFFGESGADQHYAGAIARFIGAGAKAIVPPLFHVEVAEFLMRRRRTRAANFSQAKLNAVLKSLDGFDIHTVLDIASYRDLIVWAAQYHVQAKDAPFVHLATREGLPLATLDNGQRQAAKALKLPLLPIPSLN